MANVYFKYGTEAQILALTPASSSWVERAFYYPSDKTYFYQALNGVMKKYASGEGSSVGIKLNGRSIGGVKSLIELNDTLEIPENWNYNTFSLDVDGVINMDGQINMI